MADLTNTSSVFDGTRDNLGGLEDNKKRSSSQQDNESGNTLAGETTEFQGDIEKQKTAEGDAKFHRLGWKRLTIILIVEAIALGSLSLPGAFAQVGMVAGVLLSVGLGLVAIYSSLIVGEVKLRYSSQVAHYADIGTLMGGRIFYEILSGMFVLMLVLLVGSHVLTGTIALLSIIGSASTTVCAVGIAVVSAVIMLILAIPPSFAELSILGMIDFASIMLAIGITIIATGIQAGESAGGMSSVEWSAWPAEGTTFAEAFIAVTNIVFAYSFAICLPSFMDEMKNPADYKKSCWALGIIEIFIYTFTGAIIYAFVGNDVQSPALLSAGRGEGSVIPRIAFGVALPVIFISGSINTTVVSRYIHGRVYKNSITRFINTKKGWITWLALITVVTVLAFVIAEAIPFFDNLLSICSSLFISGFTFYFPAMMWFFLIRDGSCFSKQNLFATFANAASFIIGIVVLVAGTYASVVEINQKFKDGDVNGVFSCQAS